jgi:methyltransferase
MILLPPFVASTVLRWWVIRTLGEHWNVRVLNSVNLDVVASGPYRWIRHPNYVAVYTELVFLPLIHSAWLTAILGGLAHLVILFGRIRSEEAVLMTTPQYVEVMGSKPRFLPRSRR